MEDYNPAKLFDLKKDTLLYKNENSVNTFLYNTKWPEAILDTSGQVPFLRFSIFEDLPYIRHGFSTRLGGVSEGDFSTLNLSFVRGDHKEKVAKNYERILDTMGMKETQLIFSDQVHDTKIHVVTKEDAPKNNRFERNLEGIDGLVTNVENLTLVTSYADCVPIYFVDPVNKAIGLSHSGWKGTLNKIGQKTLKVMHDTYGTEAKDVLVAIGPSICFDCYEISKEVADLFLENFSDEFGQKILYDKGNGKYQLDLWLTNKLMLQEVGVLEENIQISNICTNCNHSLLFSHRASGGKRGNLAAFLAIVE